MIVRRGRNFGVCARGIGVLTVDNPLAAWSASDRAHPGAAAVVQPAAFVNRERQQIPSRCVDDRLYPRDLEIVEMGVIQRRGDGPERMLDIGLTVHC